MELRAALDRNIQMLQVRAARQGDLTVRRISLLQQVCFCKRYQCEDASEAANRLRDTYIAASHFGIVFQSRDADLLFKNRGRTFQKNLKFFAVTALLLVGKYIILMMNINMNTDEYTTIRARAAARRTENEEITV